MSQNEVGRVILSLALRVTAPGAISTIPLHTHTHTLGPGIMVNYYMGKRN